MAFPLPSDFAALFRREPYQEPAMTRRGAFNRTVLIAAGTVLGAAVLMELPSRPYYRSHPTGAFKLIFSVAAAVLMGSYFIYTLAWRPWRDGPPGYQLVGEFEVREKDHLFSKCWVRLVPGHNYQVEVKPELYEQLRVGSRLRLIYTAGGELVSLMQLS